MNTSKDIYTEAHTNAEHPKLPLFCCFIYIEPISIAEEYINIVLRSSFEGPNIYLYISIPLFPQYAHAITKTRKTNYEAIFF